MSPKACAIRSVSQFRPLCRSSDSDSASRRLSPPPFPAAPPLSSAPTAYSTFGSCIKLSARLNRCNCKSSFLLRTHGKGEAPGREEGRRICSHGHLTVGALLCSVRCVCVCVCEYQAQLEHSSALDAAGALSGTFLLRTSFHSIPFRSIPFLSRQSLIFVCSQTDCLECVCVCLHLLLHVLLLLLLRLPDCRGNTHIYARLSLGASKS